MDKLYAIEYKKYQGKEQVNGRDVFETESDMLTGLAYVKKYKDFSDIKALILIKQDYKI